MTRFRAKKDLTVSPADRRKSAQTHPDKPFIFGIMDGYFFSDQTCKHLHDTGLTAGKVKKQYNVYYLIIIMTRSYKYPYKHHGRML